MRKRQQYQNTKAKSKIPTLIIMCMTLFMILVFGKSISWKVASIFEPTVPVKDLAAEQATVAVSDLPTTQETDSGKTVVVPTKSGMVIAQANRNAAQKILKIISDNSQHLHQGATP